MFDPHRVGPSSSSYYDRNKGRVLQRKLVDPISQPLTRSQLLSYLPIMRLNGIVDTPLVRHFFSQDSTFSFDSDTYLALGSTVTFSGSVSAFHINKMQIIPEDGSATALQLSQFQYTSNADTITISGDGQVGYYVLIYISFNPTSANYSIHTDARNEESTLSGTFQVPANSLYYILRHQTFPISFQLFAVGETGLMAYYSPEAATDIYGVLNSQVFHFDDDRLATN